MLYLAWEPWFKGREKSLECFLSVPEQILFQDNAFLQSWAAAQFKIIYMKIDWPGKRMCCYCAFIMRGYFVLLQESSDAFCQLLFEVSVSKFGKEKSPEERNG